MKFFLLIVLLGTALARPQDDDKLDSGIGDLSEVVGSLPAGSPSLILDSEPISSSTSAPTTSSARPVASLTLNNGASDSETTQAPRGVARIVEFARTIPSRFATLGARASTGFARLREFRQGIRVNEDSLAYRTGRRISTTIQSLLKAARERADRFIARQNAARMARNQGNST